MIVLDCESRDSTLASLADIFDADATELDAYLRALDLEAHYCATQPLHSGETELFHLVRAKFGKRKQIDRVCWFHLTRTHPTIDFRDGIQPLSVARPRVWDTIIEAFRNIQHEDRLKRMRREGVGDFQYVLKASDPIHAGPYDFLVREGAFHASRNSNHDYLGLPETMEDICNGYLDKHGERLYDDLKSALSPMIVKFWSEYEYGLETALHYLYVKATDRTDGFIPNTCYDGDNQAVPAERVLGVERVRQ